jgi:hypothetical protein
MVRVAPPRLNTVSFLVRDEPAPTVPKSIDPGTTSISGRARVVWLPQSHPASARRIAAHASRGEGGLEGIRAGRADEVEFCAMGFGS